MSKVKAQLELGQTKPQNRRPLGSNRLGSRRPLGLRLFVAVPIVLLVGFLIWLFASALSAKAELQLVTTIALPDLNNPANVASAGHAQPTADGAVAAQGSSRLVTLVSAGAVVGYYDSWWTGRVEITADAALIAPVQADTSAAPVQADTSAAPAQADTTVATALEMSGATGVLKISIGDSDYSVSVSAAPYSESPTFGERLLHSFGWNKSGQTTGETATTANNSSDSSIKTAPKEADFVTELETEPNISPTYTSITEVPSENCTIKYGYLMLINPNFTVTTDFIDARRSELVSVSSLYGINEHNPYNGDNLLDAEAATHLNQMVKAYEAEYPGHTLETLSCYRARGTQCGRLCAATGTSDHHTGLTCDLIDATYGVSLDTDQYAQHLDWQWLYANSYKYGFIDRFPAEWAGGSMDEPLNVDENGSTGLFETWHYRYVGVGPATEIATGKYNGGRYDSLEHYLKSLGLVTNLKTGTCD